MIRFVFTALFVLAAGACGGGEPEGPGRPMYPQQPVCQWKTPCPKAETPRPAPAEPAPDGGISPDGGALDGGTLPR